MSLLTKITGMNDVRVATVPDGATMAYYDNGLAKWVHIKFELTGEEADLKEKIEAQRVEITLLNQAISSEVDNNVRLSRKVQDAYAVVTQLQGVLKEVG